MTMYKNSPVNSRPGALIEWVIDGDLISSRVDSCRKSYEEVVGTSDRDWAVLQIELSAVRVIDSVGLNLLVTIIKKAKAAKKTVHLANPTAPVRKILMFTRIDHHAVISMAESV